METDKIINSKDLSPEIKNVLIGLKEDVELLKNISDSSEIIDSKNKLIDQVYL